MKWLPVCALIWPLSVAAEGFVEAVSVEQLPGLENTYPAWSPDGSKLVFESTRDGSDADILVMNSHGAGVVQLTDNDVAELTPAFTPDGQFIVYASEQDGNLDIFRMRVDGSEKQNLTRHPGTDGQRIYFNSNRSSDPATFALGEMDRLHDHEIYSMTLDGSDVQRVTDLPDWDTYRRSRRTATNSFGGASHRPAASPNPVAIRRSSG